MPTRDDGQLRILSGLGSSAAGTVGGTAFHVGAAELAGLSSWPRLDRRNGPDGLRRYHLYPPVSSYHDQEDADDYEYSPDGEIPSGGTELVHETRKIRYDVHHAVDRPQHTIQNRLRP
jgi:hypothetical protein